jgi:hypothetical protein
MCNGLVHNWIYVYQQHEDAGVVQWDAVAIGK